MWRQSCRDLQPARAASGKPPTPSPIRQPPVKLASQPGAFDAAEQIDEPEAIFARRWKLRQKDRKRQISLERAKN